MTVEEQRPQIPLLRRGHPDRRKSILQQEAQEQLRIASIMFLPPWLGRANRRRMAHAARHAQLLHQSNEPAHRARGLDAHHGRLGKGRIELPNRLAVMTQRLFDDLPGVAIQHRDGLLARM